MKDFIAWSSTFMNSLRQTSILVIWLGFPHRMRLILKTMRWITFGWVSLAIFNLLGRAVTSGLNNLENWQKRLIQFQLFSGDGSMDSVSMKYGMYRWFSGQGTPSAETADFRNAFVSDSDEARCEVTDLIIAGRTEVLRASFGKFIDCVVPRAWRALQVVGK